MNRRVVMLAVVAVGACDGWASGLADRAVCPVQPADYWYCNASGILDPVSWEQAACGTLICASSETDALSKIVSLLGRDDTTLVCRRIGHNALHDVGNFDFSTITDPCVTPAPQDCQGKGDPCDFTFGGLGPPNPRLCCPGLICHDDGATPVNYDVGVCCIEDHASCSATDECCPGALCIDGVCVPPCGEEGDYCDVDSDCCSLSCTSINSCN